MSKLSSALLEKAMEDILGYAKGETYLPEELLGQRFYQPVDRGLEIKIAEKLAQLRSLDEQAQSVPPDAD